MRGILPVGAFIVLMGCAAPIPKTEQDTPVLPPPGAAADVLAPGDVVELIYTRTNAGQSGPYLLQVGDVISVDVADQPDLTTRDLRVLPDGRVAIRIVGSVRVAGRSVDQVSRSIAAALVGQNVPSPNVVVSVQSANQRLEQFMRSAAPDSMGSRLDVRLASDEQISLPLITPIPAIGRPLSAVRDDITDAYGNLFGPQLNVTVNLHEQSEALIYVGGEVIKPGILQLKASMNPAMAIAGAGGLSPIGDKTQILVVRFRPDGSFYHWTVNLTSIQSAQQSPGFEVPLRNRDVIYVSRTGIGDVNEFVDLYLRKNVPIPFGLGLSP